jgi:hypothetical protein
MVWPQAMGKRAVLIGAAFERRVDEQLARRALDGREHARIEDALPPQRHDERDRAVILGLILMEGSVEQRLQSVADAMNSVRLRCSGVTEMRPS